MIENLGVCKGPGTILGEFRVGSTGVQLSKIGKCFYALINKRIVLSAKSEKDLVSRGIPVVAHIIKNLMKTAQMDELRWKPLDKNYNPLMDQTLKSISKSIPAEIFVLELKPDEIQDNAIIDASTKNVTLEDYKTCLKKFAETVDCVRHGSEILLRTNLDKNMWGSKEVMAVLADIKNDMSSLSENYETVEGCFEHSADQIDIMQRSFERKLASSQLKDTIGKVIENFSILKSYMSGLIQASQKLYTIDGVFKNRVGYPATWFFNGSTYMDFLFDHENMVDHLIKMASIEADVIEPLLVKKMTGVK
jgi:hypothetical protein